MKSRLGHKKARDVVIIVIPESKWSVRRRRSRQRQKQDSKQIPPARQGGKPFWPVSPTRRAARRGPTTHSESGCPVPSSSPSFFLSFLYCLCVCDQWHHHHGGRVGRPHTAQVEQLSLLVVVVWWCSSSSEVFCHLGGHGRGRRTKTVSGQLAFTTAPYVPSNSSNNNSSSRKPGIKF